MRKPPIPEADAELWRQVAESARPLRHKRARARNAPETASVAPSEPEAAGKDAASRPRPKIGPRPVPPPVLHPGAAPGVDRNTAARLRKGEIPVDATLDLHGMTQAEAHSALLAQIARAHTQGQRCLLVITGKGTRAGGREPGVLRANVPRWLNEPPARAHVLVFAAARPRHGGEGALYVLLRRKRDARADPRATQMKGPRP